MYSFIKKIFLGFILLVSSVSQLSAFDEETENMLFTISVCENGIQAILNHVEASDTSWGMNEKRSMEMLNQEEKREVRFLWSSMLDYFAQLDYVMNKCRKYYSYGFGLRIKDEEFLCYYYSFVIQFHYALAVLDKTENNLALHIILNEADPNSGLGADTYSQFKNHFLSMRKANKYLALQEIINEYNPNLTGFEDELKIHSEYISRRKGRGIKLSLYNAVRITKGAAFSLWFPLQRGVSKWMGGTKINRRWKALITKREIHEIEEQLNPGDIMFQRREWYLTNVGIPGYWTHSAIYIGTPSVRRLYFDDPDVKEWVKTKGVNSGDFEELLQRDYPSAYQNATEPEKKGYVPAVIESIEPGVVFQSMNKSLKCDGVVALRPRLNKKEIAIAIYRAFSYAGRPYDFNFDFLTDNSLLCTELLFKSFEPTNNYKGMTFCTDKVLSRIMISANNMVREFDQTYGTDKQQLDFILFYDQAPHRNRAVPSTVEAFRTSWQRSDWYFLHPKEN